MPKNLGRFVPTSMTTERRDLITPLLGQRIWNTTTNQNEYWNGTVWLPLIDSNNIINHTGSINTLTDVDISNAPNPGDNLVWDGNNWIPSSATPVNTNNYVFAYSTFYQAHTLANTWRRIGYNNRPNLSGWSYNETIGAGLGTLVSPIQVTDAYFTAPETGLYAATIETIVAKAAAGTPTVAIRATINNSEVLGTHNGMTVTSNNTSFSVSRTALFNITNIAHLLRIEWAVSNIAILISPAPSPGSPTAIVSTALTIRRLT